MLSYWAILNSTFMFPMQNIIISIIIHNKGGYLWSITTFYIDNSFSIGGSCVFLLFCEEILKHYYFFSPNIAPKRGRYCLNPFLQLILWYISQTQLLLHSVGAFWGEQWTHENRQSLPPLWCLIQQKVLETPGQLLQSPNRGHGLFLRRWLVCRIVATQQLLGE